MTTFTGSSSFSKPFSYKPEDDPLFDADTKALMSGAAQASLSRLQKPGGVWGQEEFDKITRHYMKPIEEQTKQRSEALQAFFRARGWTDSGSAPEKNLKLFADAERQAAENVYVPLTLEAIRQRDVTAQADINQAANLGQQRLNSYLQSRGQQFTEYSTGRQLDQTDAQVGIALRGMAVQERSQLLNEVNSAAERARAAGEQTGVYTDPQTGQSFETLQAKRDQLARVIQLAEQTGYVPVDIARESGVPEGEVGGFKLGDFLTAEEIDALRGTAPATGGGTAGTAPGALSPAQQSYVDTVTTNYDLSPEEKSQITSLFTSGSTTALQDIQTIVMTAYNRKLAALQAQPETPTPEQPAGPTGGETPPAEGGTPPAGGTGTPAPGNGSPPAGGGETPTAGPTSLPAMAAALMDQVRSIGGTAEDLTELERRLRAGDVSGALNLAQQVDERRESRTLRAVKSTLAAGQPVPRNLWAQLTESERTTARALPGFRLAKV